LLPRGVAFALNRHHLTNAALGGCGEFDLAADEVA
jgi:hypothetical protein